jgi:glycolate oxidase
MNAVSSADQRASLVAALRAVAPGVTLLETAESIAPFETDAFIGYRAMPLVVAMPQTEAECVAIVSYCAKANIPVVTRGAGTGISGGAIPDANGVLLVMTRMRAMTQLDALARVAVVEPGHRNQAVTDVATAHGLFYAPDPSSQLIASIGGNVAENSGGIHCLKYGLTIHNVMAVRLVTSEGDVLNLGSRALDAPGFDLIALAIGSEGNLGTVTEATLRLTPEPEVIVTLLAAFDSVHAAAAAVGDIIGGTTATAGVIPAALEMMDKSVIDACEQFMQAGFPRDCEALLLCELDGDHGTVANEEASVRAALAAHGARDVRAASGADERTKLWKSRKGAFTMLAAIHPDYYTIDGSIPRGALPQVLSRIEALAREYGLFVANVFHAGDGNIHPCIFYDGTKDGEMARSEELAARILEYCIEVGGTITGEHGVGIEKLREMCVQFRAPELAAFHAVKAAFDPAGVMNPGKAVPSLKRCAEWGGMRVQRGRVPHADVPRF